MDSRDPRGGAPELTRLIEAAEYFAKTCGDRSANLANILINLAECLSGLEQYAGAESAARDAMEILGGIRDRLDTASRGALVPRALTMWSRSLRGLKRNGEASKVL